MRSMTGFGRGVAVTDNGQIVVEIKSVNHRFLEVRTKVPADLSRMDTVLEKCVRERLSRGYCNVHLTIEQLDSGSACINEKGLSSYIRQLKKVASETATSAESLIPILCNAPDLFQPSPSLQFDDHQEQCVCACEAALDALVDMREHEGRFMAADVQKRLQSIEDCTNEIEAIFSAASTAVLEKYRHRISEMLQGQMEPDSTRIETEAAILAEKADISEEIIRLNSHTGQMRKVFSELAPVGRKMDFLIQEMGREANTIASKSIYAEITHLVVDIKGELEKIRELIQNIE